jgi:Ca2+/H+ antiporter
MFSKYRTVHSEKILVPNNVPIENFKYVWETRRKQRRRHPCWQRSYLTVAATAALAIAVVSTIAYLSTVYLTPKEHESSSKKLLNTEQSKENDRTSTEDELVSSKSSFPSKDDINKTISCPDLCSTSRESVCGSDGVTVGFF